MSGPDTPRHWIQTCTGVAFDLDRPLVADVRARDLAHSLAGINRFGGHLRVFYSVAQHSILAAALVWQRTRDRVAALAALLHDAHEAYIGDLKEPVKRLINAAAPGAIAGIEREIDSAISAWAGLDLGQGDADVRRLIKAADMQLLFWERDRWMSRPPRPWLGESEVLRLRAEDFGVLAGSPLLDAWRPEDAEAAMHWCLELLLPEGDGAARLASPSARIASEMARAFKGAL